MKLAYFSPLPPAHSGIADYSHELLPHLARGAEIDLFISDQTLRDRRLKPQFAAYHYDDYERRYPEYSAAVYHLGNDLSHEHILETAVRVPSFAVLHDVSLHPLIVAVTAGRGDLIGYMREMGYAYGREGLGQARAAFATGHYPYEAFPLFQRLVDLSLGIVVHSQHAADMVRAVRPRANLAVIPHGVSRPKGESRELARQRLGLATDRFIVASLGFATPSKRLEPALRAFARFQEQRPDSYYLVVGEVPPWYDLAQVVDGLGLQGKVLLTGRVSMRDFYSYASAADVCVNLRYPVSGETSGSLLRVMSIARPVIVSEVGSFAEMPAGTCLKVPVDQGEEEAIFEGLEQLQGDEELRRRLGRQARAYVELHHSWKLAAEAYLKFIDETLRCQ